MACSDEKHDRLSNLSDDLICHICSFLSTKESYRTCVLSKRWESICTKIPNLHFQLPEISDPVMSKEEIKSLQLAFQRRSDNIVKLMLDSKMGCQPHDVHLWVSKAFVNFALLRRTENIRKLRLDSEKGCQSHDVHMWVSKALDLKVQELDLDLFLHEKVLLPLQLSTCESLVVLKLRGRIQPTLNSSFHVYLPSLKILHLRETVTYSMFDDGMEYDLNNFLSGCPHLEELLLHDTFALPINTSFHLLKRLFLLLYMPTSSIKCCPLQINAPSLEVLHVGDVSLTPRKYDLTNLSTLDEAAICICKRPDFNNLYTLLKGLSNVKTLALGSKTFHFLSMEDKLDSLHLLTFHNLLFLTVEISENCSWNMLINFLQNAPKLKDLAIAVGVQCGKFEINSRRKEVGNSRWVEPSVTPACLTTSLITFEFKGIQNIKTELDFTRYIVSHSTKLQKVKIFTLSSKKRRVEKSLRKGSKKSSLLVWDINSIEDHLDSSKISMKTTQPS
ncbi:putative F-box domain, FBD domain, leucine-rich repeat domain, L domain-containing protein [Medicago truncatula]|uniref:F-box/RNI/FBD-like domain protein n=1 Tax=Medicago truncatula TaxID=3880 RepID=A0A072UVN2_MEDTR|nr:F-box/LRR-repeat protein At4g14103 [Medicago truncatula]KEH29905.1 F-box/RNI/FBD-like domain protein [Medicago truncatula]RHN60583.1 putative F-box domain, FBD domain, leucine-rich repeat domain, L domain-containing protein [Medicago truncatula]